MITYYTECGCVLDQSGIAKTKDYIPATRRYARHNVCKTHGGKVIKRTSICKECGKVMECHPNRGFRKLCHACRLRLRREWQAQYDMDKRNGRRFKPIGQPDGCVHYGEVCGKVCVRPYFECRMYNCGESQEEAA